MKAAPMADVVRRPPRRNAAIVVADPRIAIVESGARVDPSALDDALGLLATWAIRSCSDPQPEQRAAEILGRPAATAEAPTPRHVAAYGPED